MSAERDFAIAYNAHGWPTPPLHGILSDGRCGCGDPTCDAVGKHPVTRGWQNTVASVPAAESIWRGPHAHRGVGLVTGERSGMFALDVDNPAALSALEAEHAPLPESLRTETGSGGCHILFEWPADGPPVTNSNGLPAGLDVRGRGGFIVLPPSLHASGRRYRWLVPPKHGWLAPAPAWLLDLIRSTPAATTNGQGARRTTSELVDLFRGRYTHDNGRHDHFRKVCGVLLRRCGDRLAPDVLLELAVSWAQMHTEPCKSRAELERNFDNLLHRERTRRVA